MAKKITDAEASAMVATATGPDSAKAASAKKQLVRWTEDETPFDCEATRRWVAHMVMIHGLS